MHIKNNLMRQTMDNSTKRNQVRKTFLCLSEEPRTRLQVAEITGIRRANVCWYIRDFRKRNQVAVFKKGPCPVSKHKAEFLTTDPDLFPDEMELDLFPTNNGGEFSQ
jgi:hypothetical protein